MSESNILGSITPDLFPYNLVRVVQLIQPAENYDGWKMNRRNPAIGDIGTIVEVLKASGHPDHFVVESSGIEGMTIWLSDFLAEEIEAVSSP